MAVFKAVAGTSFAERIALLPGQATGMNVGAVGGDVSKTSAYTDQGTKQHPTEFWEKAQGRKNSGGSDFSCNSSNGRKSSQEALQLRRLGRRMQVPPGRERPQIAKLDGQLTEAVEALDSLVQQGSYVHKSVLYRVLKRCISEKDLTLGTRLHVLTLRSGYESNSFLANHIIRMYASHGRLQEATHVFNNVAARDTFLWCSIILANAENGQPTQAIHLYRQMRQSSVRPNSYVYVAVLKACAIAADLRSGKQVHADILEDFLEPDVFVASCLVDMYSKCGSLEDARSVFDGLTTRNVVTWTAMIAGYARQGLGREALALYASMQEECMTPADIVTFVSLVQACASIGALDQGKRLHAHIQQTGLEFDVVVGSCLVDMYAKCGSLTDARTMFDKLPKRNVVTWTAMISGYAQHGLGHEALTLYVNMKQEGIAIADPITVACLLRACSSIGALHQGKQLHALIEERGLYPDVVIGSCLVDMYAKCGSLVDARRVFDKLPTKNVVTWTGMISGYAQQGLGQEALALYASMQENGMAPADLVTFACLLQACSSVGALQQGKQLHALIKQRGLIADLVIGNCLVNMYSKCGSLEDARQVFDALPTKDAMTWNTMIAGYSQQGMGQEALTVYKCMEEGGIVSTDHTFVCLLAACASIGALSTGRALHAKLKDKGLETNLVVGNSLVDMYAKCGSLGEARRFFNKMLEKDVVTWNALLNGYAEHSNGLMAIQFFQEMQEQGVKPDDSTFSCLLVACSHQGLVVEGQQYFKMMVEEHGILPTAQHYNCMVDLFGRSGHLDEAENVLQTMPFENNVVGWTSLLTACKSHGDLERGSRCFNHLIKVEPENATSYVLLANIYGNSGRWSDVDRIESLRKSSGVRKKRGKACIEVHNNVHEFIVGKDRADISLKLRSVSSRLKGEGGHVPHTELVLKPVSVSEKEDALCGHAEKLALAYGLLNTPDGTTLLVTKNLRMCSDCHSGTKIMSRLEKREIIVRDAHRVHRFVDGSCSCGDRH